MDKHQTAILTIALLIFGIRLAATQRLQNAWSAIFASKPTPSSGEESRGYGPLLGPIQAPQNMNTPSTTGGESQGYGPLLGPIQAPQ